MSLAGLLVVYCGLILIASLVGGWLPIFVRLTHRGTELAISFVAGVILGVGLLHLLPHGFYELESIDETVQWVLIGFLLMFFIERFLHFHHHGPPAEDILHSELHVHAADHAHAHEHRSDPHAVRPRRTAWLAAAVGLTLHGAVEGIALAAAVSAERLESPAAALAGFSTFLAIVLHKPFDSLTILTLMSASGASLRRRHAINALYALVIPLGVALYTLAAARAGVEPNAFLGRSLCFAAGTFLCIATSDLLPELQFHRHDRLKLTLALVTGLALAWMLVQIEGHTHHHEHGEHSHSHADD